MAVKKTTKELAIELGLIRKRKLSTLGKNINQKKWSQVYSYLIVLDFESTCWKNDKGRPQEIIEFPAVLLNTRTGEVEDEFQHYVQPQEQPTLSAFCTELTGITQGQVEDGIPLANCLSRFSNWLMRLHREKGLAYNDTQTVGLRPCTFVTWSDWDLGVCLLYECRRKQLRKPPELSAWIDLRATYRKFYARKPQGLNGAMKDVGIVFEGREHSGLDDSRNTARLVWKMIRDGCVMTVTKTLPEAKFGKNAAKMIGPPNTAAHPQIKAVSTTATATLPTVCSGAKQSGNRCLTTQASRTLANEVVCVAPPTRPEVSVSVRQIVSTTHSHRLANCSTAASITTSSTHSHRLAHCTTAASITSSSTHSHRLAHCTTAASITTSSSRGSLEQGATVGATAASFPTAKTVSVSSSSMTPTLNHPVSLPVATRSCQIMAPPALRSCQITSAVNSGFQVTSSAMRFKQSATKVASNTTTHSTYYQPSSASATVQQNVTPSNNVAIQPRATLLHNTVRQPSTCSTLSKSRFMQPRAILSNNQFMQPRTTLSNSGTTQPRTTLSSSGFIQPRTSLSNNGFMQYRTPLSNSGFMQPRTTLSNSGFMQPRTTLSNSGFMQPRTTLSNSGFMQPRTILSNSGIMQPKTTLSNNGFMQPRTTLSNNRFMQPRSTLPNNLVMQTRPSLSSDEVPQPKIILSNDNPFRQSKPTIANNVVMQSRGCAPSKVEVPSVTSVNTSAAKSMKSGTPVANSSAHTKSYQPPTNSISPIMINHNMNNDKENPLTSTVAKSRFKVPTPPQGLRVRSGNSLFNSLNSSTDSECSDSSSRNSSLFKTPSPIAMNASAVISSNMKRTPPMCSCGRRATRKVVQSPGPNQGRVFFCCPKGKNQRGERCQFFKWDTPLTSGSHTSPHSSVSTPVTPFGNCHIGLSGKKFISPPAQPNFNTPDTNRLKKTT